MVWPLTVIRGVGKCATSRHKFEPSFSLTHVTFRYLALASPLLCPQPPFLPPRPRLQDTQNHKGQGSSQGEALFTPAPQGARMGRGGHAGGLVRPTPFMHEQGPSLFPPLRSTGRYMIPPAPLLHANLPLLRPAPRLCTNRVSVGVTQGQGHRPFYAPPLRSPAPAQPRRLQGRRRYMTPRFAPACYDSTDRIARLELVLLQRGLLLPDVIRLI
jgi:hypothetical protein